MNENDKSDCIRNKKDKLSEICSLLEINNNVLLMPKDRYTMEAIDSEQRAFERAERIIRCLTASICDLVSPSNAKFKGKIMEKEINYDPDIKNLALNTIQLVFFGNQNTREIINSLLTILI